MSFLKMLYSRQTMLIPWLLKRNVWSFAELHVIIEYSFVYCIGGNFSREFIFVSSISLMSMHSQNSITNVWLDTYIVYLSKIW